MSSGDTYNLVIDQARDNTPVFGSVMTDSQMTNGSNITFRYLETYP